MIKNQTPLLPYVIRPLVYEESFAEFIDVEDFVPERAFLQATGFFPVGKAKLDYAAFVGNSPNIRSQFDSLREGAASQTGADTTATILVGGRLGVRYGELKLGGSATRDIVNSFSDLLEGPLGLPRRSLGGVPRTRLGADLSFHLGNVSFEGEVIAVRFDVDPPPGDGPRPRIDPERTFYYGTVGYHFTERLFAYGSYWYTEEVFQVQALDRDDRVQGNIEVPTAGIRFTLLQDDAGFDRVTLKAQYAYARIRNRVKDTTRDDIFDDTDSDDRLNFFAIAVSVLF